MRLGEKGGRERVRQRRERERGRGKKGGRKRVRESERRKKEGGLRGLGCWGTACSLAMSCNCQFILSVAFHHSAGSDSDDATWECPGFVGYKSLAGPAEKSGPDIHWILLQTKYILTLDALTAPVVLQKAAVLTVLLRAVIHAAWHQQRVQLLYTSLPLEDHTAAYFRSLVGWAAWQGQSNPLFDAKRFSFGGWADWTKQTSWELGVVSSIPDSVFF